MSTVDNNPDKNKPKDTVVSVPLSSNTQVEDIRLMLLDAMPDDYSVKTGDYWFSDSEILDAIRRAVEAYNALPPSTLRSGISGIPDPYLMKVGACWQACLSKALYYKRKQTTYNTGSTQVDMYGGAVNAMMEASQAFKQEFQELALSIKRQSNIRRFFGRIG
jgi:hypothetical protein